MSQDTSFNENNWNFSQFVLGDLTAFISLCGENNNENIEYFYSLTVVDQDNKELFQKDFKVLSEACNSINSKYQDYWQFQQSIEEKKEGSGCDSCVAH